MSSFNRAKGRIRKRLWKLENGRCYWCGRETIRDMPIDGRLTALHATIDHVVPISLGGKNNGNIVLACCECNTRRKNDPPEFWPVDKSFGTRLADLLSAAISVEGER